MPSALILDDHLRAAVARVRANAARRENLFDPGSKDAVIPGDNPDLHFRSGTFKCVLSWSKNGDGRIFRHFSVSTRSGASLPQPVMVYTIAHMLGFTGAEADQNGMVWRPPMGEWGMDVDRQARCVVVVQDLGMDPWKDDVVGAAEARSVPGPGTAQ